MGQGRWWQGRGRPGAPRPRRQVTTAVAAPGGAAEWGLSGRDGTISPRYIRPRVARRPEPPRPEGLGAQDRWWRSFAELGATARSGRWPAGSSASSRSSLASFFYQFEMQTPPSPPDGRVAGGQPLPPHGERLGQGPQIEAGTAPRDEVSFEKVACGVGFSAPGRPRGGLSVRTAAPGVDGPDRRSSSPYPHKVERCRRQLREAPRTHRSRRSAGLGGR